MSHQLTVGSRIQVQGHIATVRFVGPVDGTQGEWLGIEWDDPTRGKHDGTHNGKRYFECRSSTGGSFIRFHPEKVLTGRPFMEALTNKYLDDVPTTQEYDESKDIGEVVFGANKNIIVKTVGFEKVQRKQQQLSLLTVVGLANQQISSAGSIREHQLSIRDLDLSQNLITDWKVVADIVSQLPHLQILRLNHSRLSLGPLEPGNPAFDHIQALALKSADMTWAKVEHLAPYFKRLDELHLTANNIHQLSALPPPLFQQMKCINLEDNALESWDEVVKLGHLPNLETLFLNGNKLSSIKPVEPGLFAKLSHLRVDSNQITEWQSIDALNTFVSLHRLRCKRNPVLHGLESGDVAAQVVGRVARVNIVDGNTLTPRERSDFERYYLKLCTKDGQTHDEIAAKHPRYRELCAIHGEPDLAPAKEGNTLNNRLVGITISQRLTRPTNNPTAILNKTDLSETTGHVTKRVLTTMLLRNVRHIIQKLLRIPASHQLLFLLQPSPTNAEQLTVMELTDDLRELKFYGITEGDEIAVVDDRQ